MLHLNSNENQTHSGGKEHRRIRIKVVEVKGCGQTKWVTDEEMILVGNAVWKNRLHSFKSIEKCVWKREKLLSFKAIVATWFRASLESILPVFWIYAISLDGTFLWMIK